MLLGQADDAQERRVLFRFGPRRRIAFGVFGEGVDLNPGKLGVAAEERVSHPVAAGNIGKPLQGVGQLHPSAVFPRGIGQAGERDAAACMAHLGRKYAPPHPRRWLCPGLCAASMNRYGGIVTEEGTG